MPDKRLVVFGATGTTGQQIVRQGLQAGLVVTAFTRHPTFPLEHPRLRIVQGTLDSLDDLRVALQDQAYIASALGARDFTHPSLLISDWVQRIIPLAEATTRRIIVIAGAGMLQADAQRLNRDLPSYPAALRHVNHDHDLAFQALQASGLDWTLMCPPTIEDGPQAGTYLTSVDYPPAQGQGRISPGNLGHCIVQALLSGQFIHQRVGISTLPDPTKDTVDANPSP